MYYSIGLPLLASDSSILLNSFMFKFFFRLICLAVIAAIAFLIISLSSGGDKFRWFGKKVEEKTESLGEKADKIKKASDKTMEGVKKAKEKIKDLTGK